jgi:prephenate dehydratase
MLRIATLGPKGTFSDIAATRYQLQQNQDSEIHYFGSIKQALQSIGSSCDIGVLPIENLSEGYVSVVLDHLINEKLYIIDELVLPIKFSFVSKKKEYNKIKSMYVQYVAKGQCSEFIDSLGNIEIIFTESNIQSLESARINSSAIVPTASFDRDEFNIIKDNVNDYINNETRFFVLSNSYAEYKFSISQKIKTSIVILDDYDRPGLLCEVLKSFSKRNINLTSIISRPTKSELGRYNFFIELEGCRQNELVSQALEELNSVYKIKLMGSYAVGTGQGNRMSD